jgi:hypothetical protein
MSVSLARARRCPHPNGRLRRALLFACVTAALLVVALPSTAVAANVPARGKATLVWDRFDLANVQLAHGVMVVPVGPMTLTPVSHTLKFSSKVSGGPILNELPYWGPVVLGGGIRFLKLTPAQTWTQVTVTKMTFNLKTQTVKASIDGGARVVFSLVNTMGVTQHRFSRGGHTYVRIQGAALAYAPKAAAALKAAFGYMVPDAPTAFAYLTEVLRLD